MKTWIYFFKAPRRVLIINRKRQLTKLKRQLIRIKIALAQEKAETKEMLVIYRRYTIKQATPEEMKQANKQFLDVLKGLGIGVFAVLPFAPITIPIVIKIGKWVGVDILPSSFNEESVKKTIVISNNQSPDP
ncbi:hypothetical protein [Thalassotalea castellviae]|uniref:Letm1 RBD domain-containing protein n=1 Tax=Thalassotalea castellviae TaxID=3075612 RepID=A0ABU3A1J1_9GAMM|nr:hypothetical protein [Thalassotalea sp. W431]MDT0604045.1 hypothetical protein [Thalassotalea sp. W431]